MRYLFRMEYRMKKLLIGSILIACTLTLFVQANCKKLLDDSKTASKVSIELMLVKDPGGSLG